MGDSVDHVLFGGQSKGELALLGVAALGAIDEAKLPDELAALEAEGIEGAAGDQVLDRFSFQACAFDEIEQGTEIPVTEALFFHRAGGFEAEGTDIAEADADGRGLS